MDLARTKQEWFTMFCSNLQMYLVWLFVVVATSKMALFGQSLESEFEANAREQWLELRRQSFQDLAIEIEINRKWIRPTMDPDEKEVHEVATVRKLFANKDLKFSDVVVLKDTMLNSKAQLNRFSAIVYNPEHCFQVFQNSGRKWELKAIEDSPGNFDFDPKKIKIEGSLGFETPLSTLSSLFARDDPRFAFRSFGNFDPLVENLLEYDDSAFQVAVIERNAEFGRIVTMKIAAHYEYPESLALKSNSKRAEFTGELKVLADRYWLPIEMSIMIQAFDHDDQTVGKRNGRFKAVYDPKRLSDAENNPGSIMPTEVTIKTRNLMTNRQFQVVRKIRLLNKNEVQSIRSLSDLRAFGLDDQ